VLSRARIAVFMDGCFWHACPLHAVAPKSNAQWWRTKLEANRERDTRNNAALDHAGWLVVRVWEHEGTSQVADDIEQLWRGRTGRLSGG
jgi:DNA mismatch endonuclease (patch repair protein)